MQSVKIPPPLSWQDVSEHRKEVSPMSMTEAAHNAHMYCLSQKNDSIPVFGKLQMQCDKNLALLSLQDKDPLSLQSAKMNSLSLQSVKMNESPKLRLVLGIEKFPQLWQGVSGQYESPQP